MISSVKWVPRSCAADKPAFFELSQEELDELKNGGAEDGMDDDALQDEEGDLGSDVDDVDLRESDRMLVCAKTEENGDHCSLEIYVYDEASDVLYVHHDIPLPAFPLKVVHMHVGLSEEFTTTDSVNYVAVASFVPEIEIWNLDVVDALEPNMILGSDGSGHADAVLDMSFDVHSNTLASASADGSVMLWDLQTGTLAKVLYKCSSKVNVATFSVDGKHMAIASDEELILFDLSKDSTKTLPNLDSRVECAVFSSTNNLYVGYESGTLARFNGSTGKLEQRVVAHPSSCSSVGASMVAKDVIATAGADGMVRIWMGADFEPCAERHMGVGELFEVSWDDDGAAPLQLAVGGSHGVLAIWDARDDVSNNRGKPFVDVRRNPRRDNARAAEMNDDNELLDSDASSAGEEE